MKEKKTVGGQRPRPAPDLAIRSRLSWGALEQEVVRMQKQIAQASQSGKKQSIHTLQQRLLESEAARLLAVRRVAKDNQGKDTAGVDGVKSLTAQERLAMADVIHPMHWKHQPALPVRRVWIPKPGTTEWRPLAILPMIDRCKQALVKLALEPEWEVKFEAHSYGFRPGRSTHDAIAAILVAIERRPAFVFNADIEAAFDHVSQHVVLEKLQTFPALKQAINAWFTAGVMDGNTYSTSEKGIAQGGVLSPLLMNIALHGMEAVVLESTANGQIREPPLLVRYADNFVIVHPDLSALQQAIRHARRWLATIGLRLHPQKTHITHTLTPYQGQVGFDFLGFGIRQESGEPVSKGQRGQDYSSRGRANGPAPRRQSLVKTIVTPSQDADKRHQMAIEQKLQLLQTAPQAQVIAELNPLIVGWATYYTGVVAAATMSQYDELVEQQLINWASKRHPGQTLAWLLRRYWQPLGEHGRIFATPDGDQLRAYQHMNMLRE